MAEIIQNTLFLAYVRYVIFLLTEIINRSQSVKNQAFSHSSLARSLLSKDFFLNNELIDDDYRNGIVNEAISVSGDLFQNGITLDTIELSKKTGYRITNYSEKIISMKVC